MDALILTSALCALLVWSIDASLALVRASDRVRLSLNRTGD